MPIRGIVNRALFIAAMALPAGGAGAADPSSDPQALAVNIQRTPPQPWPGYGIYLGDGLVITAAHVAGRSIVNHSRVVVAGRPLATESVKEGSYPDNDLTLLRLEPPVPPELAGLRAEICADPPIPARPSSSRRPRR